jgi:hypothetical protein
VRKTSEYISIIRVRSSEPKGKFYATGNDFIMVNALYFSLSGKTARSLTERAAVCLSLVLQMLLSQGKILQL